MVRRDFYVVVAAFLALHAVVMTAYFIVKVPADWWPAICKQDECTFAGWFSAFGNWSSAVVAIASYFLLQRQIEISKEMHDQMIWLQENEKMAIAKSVNRIVTKISTSAGLAVALLHEKEPNDVDKSAYLTLVGMKDTYSLPLFDKFENSFAFPSETCVADVRKFFDDVSSEKASDESTLVPIHEMRRRLNIIIGYNEAVSTVASDYLIGMSRLMRMEK